MLWNKCIETLRVELPESMFSLWILPLSVKTDDAEKGLIELVAPNSHFCKHIQQNYLEHIEKIATKYHGASVSVTIDIDNKIQQNKTVQPKNTVKKVKLNPLFTFEDFVIGKSNQMAYATTKNIVNDLGGNAHNPLFLYGATGLGKTHLMQALGHEMQKRNKKVRYMTADQFTQQYVSSAKNKKVDDFVGRCRDTDLLMVDDIHFLAGKHKTALTFLSLFNHLVAENKQIILTSDSYPTAIKDIDERLKSRFAWGLSVALEPPELETRINILSKKALSTGVSLPPDCALFIAKQVVANVRELEGALNKVLATARFKQEPISLELVQFALKEIVQIRAEAISINNIQKVVAEYFNISVKDMVGKKRTRAIARPRQLAMTLTRELTKHSYPEIGLAFGKRDHTTVMHAYETVQKLRENDPIFAKDYQTILAMMQS